MKGESGLQAYNSGHMGHQAQNPSFGTKLDLTSDHGFEVQNVTGSQAHGHEESPIHGKEKRKLGP